MCYEFRGRAVVVTGATSGIGLAAIKLFAKFGAYVVGIGRSTKKINQAIKTIHQENYPGDPIFFQADLASQQEIRELSKRIILHFSHLGIFHLDVLVNNAGLYNEKRQITVDGIEETFAVNHLAPFLLTNRLLSLLVTGRQSRVITVSSYAHHTTPIYLRKTDNPLVYNGLLAYKRSKLCNILFSKVLNTRYNQITAIAFDPGLVNTGIASKGSQGISHWVWKNRRLRGDLPEAAASTILYLAGNKDLDAQQVYYDKEGKPATPSKNARRELLANNLWELSCRLTGVSWAVRL